MSWVLSSCQFQWWNRTSTGDRVINVSPRSSSNASTPPFSCIPQAPPCGLCFLGKWLMSYDLKPSGSHFLQKQDFDFTIGLLQQLVGNLEPVQLLLWVALF